MLSCRLSPGNHFQLSRLHIERIGRLHQQAAADALHVVAVMRAGQGHGEHAHVLFRGGQLERGLGNAGCNDDLDELVGNDLCRRRFVQFTVEGDDAAKCGSRIGGIGQFVSIERYIRNRHAARIGMLDNDTGGLLESLDTLPGCVGIADVVIGQFLALQLRVIGNATGDPAELAEKSGALVRVLAVAHVLHLGKIKIDLRGKFGFVTVAVKRGEVVADRGVVGSGVRKGLLRQTETRGIG